MNALYDLKDMLIEQLDEYGKKGEMSTSVLEKVDILAHAAKNLDKVIESCEGEEMGGMDEYSNRSSRRSYSRNSHYGTSGSRRSGRYGRSGRSMRRGYSGNSFADQLYSMMDEVDDDQTKQEIERLASKMDQM